MRQRLFHLVHFLGVSIVHADFLKHIGRQVSFPLSKNVLVLKFSLTKG